MGLVSFNKSEKTWDTLWEEMWDIKKHNHGIKGGIWCGKKRGTQCCEKTWDMKTTCFVGRNVGYYMKKRC